MSRLTKILASLMIACAACTTSGCNVLCPGSLPDIGACG
jgi:hypothetical protein